MEIQRSTCVLIPTLNEVGTIEMVIEGFYQNGFEEILVIDGGSTDGTVEIAKKKGAKVVFQKTEGKGNAVREAFKMIDSKFILMIDGDGTYLPEDGGAMMAPLQMGHGHTVGHRFSDMEPGAMTKMNRVGNGLINILFSRVYGEERGDVLSGYHGFRKDVVDQLFLTSSGFGIEMEIAIRCLSNRVSTVVVPIKYRARTGTSAAKLNPIRDGLVIIKTLYSLAQTSRPMFYFGIFGMISLIVGGLLSVYVGIEWLYYSEVHQIVAIISFFFLLFGAQIMALGILSEIVLELHQKRIEWIGEKI
jgi:glycosyltransferase (TIGR04182 family)